MESYPVSNEDKLKSELTVIYSRAEFRLCCGTLALLKLLQECNLIPTFYETVKLLKLLVTTAMSSCEAEICFSMLKRVKTFEKHYV